MPVLCIAVQQSNSVTEIKIGLKVKADAIKHVSKVVQDKEFQQIDSHRDGGCSPGE